MVLPDVLLVQHQAKSVLNVILDFISILLPIRAQHVLIIAILALKLHHNNARSVLVVIMPTITGQAVLHVQ